MSETLTLPNADLPHRDDTFLVARNQMEMAACQSRLVVWFTEQVTKLAADARELEEAIEIALKNRWRRGTMQKHLKYCYDKILFFEKCKTAVAESYAIIPDLPCDVFAIRVDPSQGPEYDKQVSQYGQPSMKEQPADILGIGEGEYKSEVPTTRNYTEKRLNSDKSEYTVNVRESDKFQNVQFPVIAAKMKVMDATQQAMALKLFDQIAVIPQSARRKRDPMIVGRILGPRKGSYREPLMLSFVICWFLDLKTLE